GGAGGGAGGGRGVGGGAPGAPPAGPFHPGRSAQILIDDHPAGVLGEIHPRVAASLDIDGRVAVCVVGLGTLARATEQGIELREIPRFPPVHRDLAFLVPVATPPRAVHRIVREAAGELLDSSTLFDVYRGERIPPETKSLAYSIDLRAPDRTLTDEEAQVVVDRIVERLAAEVDARLRTA